MKQISKAIITVMNQVKGMEKNSRVGSGSYAYSGTKDQDVKEIFNDALAKNGLCIVPTSIEESTELSRWDENGKSRQSIFTKVKTTYLLIHESGETVELAGYGQGVDSQDKGAGKATTYALKNCLLYTFLTPVGKIDDTDTTHSNDMESSNVVVESSLVLDKAMKDKINSCSSRKELTAYFNSLDGSLQKSFAVCKFFKNHQKTLS